MKSQIVHMSQKRKRTGGEDDLKENVGIIFMDTTDICMGVPESLEKQYVQYIRELEKDREEGFAAKDQYIRQLEKDKEEGFTAKDAYIQQLEKDKEKGFAAKDAYIQQLEKDKEEGFAAKDAYIRQLEKDKEEGFAAKDAYIMQLEKEKGFKAKDIYIGELERDREEGFATKDMYIHELEERVIQVENEYLEIVKSKNEYIDRVEVLYNKEKQANRELLKDMKGIMSEKQERIDGLLDELNKIKNSKYGKWIYRYIGEGRNNGY